jgi:eukaryotic-like serine/threonine-protein kinase
MIAPSTRLGPYLIAAPIGSGGMGEVYKATDTRLDRIVAIKVLPEHVAADPDLKQRFEREAKTLAALSHPHICPVFDVGNQSGIDFLVMEYLEGDTLEQRLKKGALPLDQALQIGIQIAAALAAAHRAGIVHRDLKPGNIMLTKSGAKLLDFGLAKTGAPAVAGSFSMLPTTPPNLTAQGTILGTFQYMSPEQLEGQEADARTDIFAFGAVVYQMVTGRKAFEGKSQASLIAAIMDTEPPVASVFQPSSPLALDRVIRKCLAKDPDNRWQSARDLRDELGWVAETSAHVNTPNAAATVRTHWQWALWSAVAVTVVTVAVGVAALRTLRPSAPGGSVTRLSFMLPDGDQFEAIVRGTLAISPDGTRIVYATRRGLQVRSLADFATRLLIGGPGGPIGSSEPAFSPDGQSLAFFADGALRRISVGGGTPVTITPVSSPPLGMTWSADGILFGAGNQGIFRVSPDGGAPERLVTVSDSESAYGPQMLPGGDRILFAISQGSELDELEASRVVVHSIASGERKVVVERGRSPRYLGSGHLLYAQDSVLLAAPFDVDRLAVTGPPTPLVDGVRRSTSTGAVHFSASESGTLIYIPGPAGSLGGRVDVVIADRTGAVESLNVPAGTWEFPRVSPDGVRVALGTSGPDQNIWIYDLSSAAPPRRITFQGRNRFPVWSADGRRIAYQSDREGDLGIFWQPLDGTGAPERLTRSDPGSSHVPEAWSPRGDSFLFSVVKGENKALWQFSLHHRKGEPFGNITAGAGLLIAPAFSPDGRWVAYGNANPEPGVYVQPVPPIGTTYQATSGGFFPWWSRDGKSIIYIQGFGRLGSVGVVTQPNIKFGAPVTMTRGFNEKVGPTQGKSYDVMVDGRFIGLAVAGQGRAVVQGNQINVVLNWDQELKRLVPTR